jgi:aminomethyltransferase
VSTNRTPLYEFHIANGARMVPFAGWDMPLQYADGIKAEHLATRDAAGLFDVSHMAQLVLSGAGADTSFEQLTPTDIDSLAEGRVRYSMLLNDCGGVLDDLMVARLDGDLHLVVNAGRANYDISHILENLGPNTQMLHHQGRALLALQGPKAASVLAGLGVPLEGFRFMDIRRLVLDGVEIIVTRSGYTGEDGFEISLPSDAAVNIAKIFLDTGVVTLAGLGARDTLRLEAGLPLWGHELDENITPVAAGLEFALSKKRRMAADFPGAKVILEQLANGSPERLVGLLPDGARPVRDGAILFKDGAEIGRVTSGSFAPSLNRPAAIGFVSSGLAIQGTVLVAKTRGSEIPITVTSLPLVPHRYFRG